MFSTTVLLPRRVIAVVGVLLAVVAFTVALQAATGSSAAHADTAPAIGTGLPATVGADPLPTVQTDGVVWATATVGNTTFATGNFNFVRPPGMAATAAHTGQAQVGGLVAFTTSTGLQVPFATLKPPTLSGPGQALAVSPDGNTVYVGGTFTTANGVAHSGVAAFSAATGALISTFAADVPGTVKALVATSTAVYVGGAFTTTGAVPHHNLIALDAATGQPTLWPGQASDTVWAMVLTPDQSKLVVGGSFANLSDVNLAADGKTVVTTHTTVAHGLGALSAGTGVPQPWAANTVIHDYTAVGAIDTLTTDGTTIYAAGYATSVAVDNFEGRVAMNASTGAIIWVDSCYGDTYATLPIGKVLYSVGHDHDCSEIGSFPQQSAGQPAGEYHRPIAETTYATGGVNGAGTRGASWSFAGYPDASVLDWFPFQTPAQPSLAAEQAIAPGTVSVSGAAETGWTLSGNSSYLVVGGELSSAGDPGSVSYLPNQQGLVRYAIHSIAPNKVGPFFNSVMAPTATAGGTPGTVNLTWTAAWDRDNQDLTYQLYRDGSSTPLTTMIMPSTFWQTGAAGQYTDTALTAGSHSYVLKVSDPDGNFVKASATVSVASSGSPAAAIDDIALGKPAAESGVFPGFGPAGAVDGNTSAAVSAGAAAITTDTPQAWWQTDLQSSQPISRVNVFGRNGSSAQSGDYWVFVSNTPLNPQVPPATQATQPGVWASYQSAAAGSPTSLTPPAGTTGRYVMVQHGGTNNLSLAEVQVVGVAAPATAKLLYSTDGGATWTATPTAARGSTVLVREWFDNPTYNAANGESVTTTLPAGSTLVAGSTKVCDSPLTTNPATPNSAQDTCSASLTDTTVWSGPNLTISPSAGLFGQSSATSGILDTGKMHYLNLTSCTYAHVDPGQYQDLWQSWAASGSPQAARPTASNTPATAASCGPGDAGGLSAAGYHADGSAYTVLDTNGQRYLNLSQCSYFHISPGVYQDIDIAAATPTGAHAAVDTATNTAGSGPTCGSGDGGAPGAAGYQRGGIESSSIAVNLLGNRYLNLSQCTYAHVAPGRYQDLLTTSADPNGVHAALDTASNTPATTGSCGPGDGGGLTAPGYHADGSAYAVLDLLDTLRGNGYVQYAIVVPGAPTTLTQPAGLTGPLSAVTSGRIAVQ